MAEKLKVKEITLVDEGGTFGSFFKRFSVEREDYDFKSLAEVRALLSNERARLIHTIKIKNPKSIYALAKLVGRDFKSVNEDIKLLERFGFVDLVTERTGKRDRLRPVLIIDTLRLTIKL